MRKKSAQGEGGLVGVTCWRTEWQLPQRGAPQRAG